jgi:uncharacterized membrane protein YphA (DoxX/SURF4 family)
LSRKILLSPLRLAVGWGVYPRVLGWLGISMLVLLRVTIGWHFYTEGVEKYSAGDWDAKPFFANARGPVAEPFRRLVWDWDGAIRLDEETTKIHLATFRDRVANHYGFDDKQKRAAQVNYAKAMEQFQWVLASNASDIEEYELGKSRIENLQNDIRRDGVESLAGQTATIRAEWMKKVAPSLKQIDEIWKTYELSLNNLATREQAEQTSPLKLGVPRNQWMDTSLINQIVPYFDMAIGVCLILGFLTPVAALAAAGFLGSVFLSQYPPATGPSSTMYQLIEGVACLTLAGTGAGRFAGLDFLFHTIICKLWPNVEKV